MKTPLSLQNVAVSKEDNYFVLVLLFSLLCWAIVLLSLVGLLYVALIGFVVWLGHGLLIAHLRSESVLVSETQLPGLYQTFREVCATLGVQKVPELYVVQSGGVLNAFATRFSGRDFVVVYSDMLEAHGEDSPRMRFILGHEIGHIRRGHIMKRLLLLPGLMLPLLGAAYSRACEATCDRFGALACGDINGGIAAMMSLSGGKVAGLCMNPDAFARQHQAARGFFVSWHELTSGYPTLSQRVANLVALRDGVEVCQGGRSLLAYFFALFTMGGRAGGGVNFLMTIVIVAMLMGLFMPVVAGAIKKAQMIQQQQNAMLQRQAAQRAAAER